MLAGTLGRQHGVNQVCWIPARHSCRCMIRRTLSRAYQVWMISKAHCCCLHVRRKFWCYRKGFIAVLLQPCPWENQDENIIQMSGGLRYYEGATGHRWMDGWMFWITVYHQARFSCLLTHYTAPQCTSSYQCYVKCWGFVIISNIMVVFFVVFFFPQRTMLALMSFFNLTVIL